ncbi:MAG: glycosyltransferase [Hydrococcus sp. C42_A2020_068]|nr:glycosyltransferase [Hydrococcus sp. C42_A2020_068]
MRLSASLVLYKNEPNMVLKAVESLFNTPLEINLIVIDNSPSAELSEIFSNLSNFKIDYFYQDGRNLGFGKGHNLALSKIQNSDYHLILNPDVYFESHTIIELIDYLDKNPDIGLIQPKIYYPNGELQYLCKRYPSFFLLFARRFVPQYLKGLFKDYLNWYEMRDTGYNRIIDVPYLSGCFMLFRKKYLDEIGYFDENIFMYLEDADLTLRMSQKYRTVFYPDVWIYHHWAKGSYKSLRLMLISIRSAFYFFGKHGWRFF